MFVCRCAGERLRVYCMRALSCFLICLRLAFAILLALAPSVARTDERSVLFAENWTGDLDGIVARRTLRLLLPYSKTLFFIDRGQEFGLLAEVGRALEQWLDTRHSDGALRFRVIMIPKSREQLVQALLAGEGDVIAGGLAVRPEFADRVDFIEPWFRDQKEFVVTGPSAPDYRTLDDLACLTPRNTRRRRTVRPPGRSARRSPSRIDADIA